MRKLLFLLSLLPLFVGAEEKKTRVNCLGNSITYGIGVQNPDTESYPAQLQQLLGERYEVRRFGLPGATLINDAFRPYMKTEEFRQAMQTPCDIAIIHLGVNDTDPRSWPHLRDHFVRDYLALIDSVRRTSPELQRLIVARITPIGAQHRRFASGTQQWGEEIRQAIDVVAEVSGAELVDFYTPLHPHPDFLPDAVHPNAEGCRIMAQAAASLITGDYGGLQMPQAFSSGMVLPRDRQLPLRGTANAGERVTVKIGKQKHTATTDKHGRWQVTLNPLESGKSYTLEVSTRQRTLTFTDVLAGEVWLASGQSNMQFTLSASAQAATDVPQANHPDIRLLNYQGRWATNDVEFPADALDSINHLRYFTRATWTPCTPQTAAPFSAIGYYFALALRDSLQCPVGIICNAVGGSGIEAWVERGHVERTLPAMLADWSHSDYLQDWVRGRALRNMGQQASRLQRHPYEPCYLYEASTEELSAFPISGVLWYQGESNAHNTDAHALLFHELVGSWREAWQQPDLPFLYVQLSSLSRPSWPWFRDSQRRLLSSLPRLGMAVSSDLGDSLDVHPRQKKPLGERLVRWALHDVYGHADLVPSGPIFQQATFMGDKIIVKFSYGKGLQAADGKEILGFEVADHPGLFQPASATLQTDGTLAVSSPLVRRPRFVRYAFQPFTRANLVNADGLPASTFTTEPE